MPSEILPVMDSPDMKIQITHKEDISRDSLCIYGIPKKLSKINEEAYIPQAISIGPLHNDKPHLRAMHPNKLRYCDSFIRRTGATMEIYNEMAKGWEAEARACYQGHIPQDSNQFIEMILLDGIFMVELLLRICEEVPQEDDDVIFKKPLLKQDIFQDMLLLENQLPFFILEELYVSSKHSQPWDKFLNQVANRYFKKEIDDQIVKEALETNKIRHLVDFCHVICDVAIPRASFAPFIQQKFQLSRSATELRQAGVKFVSDNTSPPFKINFSDDKLEISSIVINKWTESFFRNLIAYEHCLQTNKIIGSYIIMMSSLLRTSKDVDIFIGGGIIRNEWLGDSEDICTLFDNIYKRSMMDSSEFYYTSICECLNEYSSDKWHQLKAAGYWWKGTLQQNYFSSPWSIISLMAGIILLILTVIQTVCSVEAMKW